MTVILAGPLAVQRLTLLDDLLEVSERIYHRDCTVFQKSFHKRWLKAVREQVRHEPVEFPGEPRDRVEARVRNRLCTYRQELRQAQAGLIALEREKRAQRDRAIRSYVASLLLQELAA
jgi:hypothetical protein